MFDTLTEADFDTLTEEALEDRAALAVQVMGEEAREENAAGARRLAAIGDLYVARAPDDDVEKLNWAIDGHTGLVAEVSAWDCDIDHTVPFPAGPTHASNLKCLCRHHHLLKTFHDGWSDTQLPTGTIVWTAPTGQVYLTDPEGGYWFPLLATSTGEIETRPVMPGVGRTAKMPLRQRTRGQDRADRINAERAANHQRLAREEQHEQARIAAINEPAPF